MYYLTSITDTQLSNGGGVVVFVNDQVVVWNVVEPNFSSTAGQVPVPTVDDKSSSRVGDKKPYYVRTGIKIPVQLYPVEQTYLPPLPVTIEQELAFIASGLDFLLKEYGLVNGFYFHCTTEVFEDKFYREYVYYLFFKGNFPASTSLDFTSALQFKRLLLLRDYDVFGIPSWYVRGLTQDMSQNFGYEILQTEKQFCVLSNSGVRQHDQVQTLLEMIHNFVFIGQLPIASTTPVDLALTFADEATGITPYSKFLFKHRTTFNLYTRGEVFLVLNELKQLPTWNSIANELVIYHVDLIFAVVFESYYLPDIARVNQTKRFIGIQYDYVEDQTNNWITFTADLVLFTPAIKPREQTLVERLSADSYPYLKQLLPSVATPPLIQLPSPAQAPVAPAA
jgi:hypothetical protein